MKNNWTSKFIGQITNNLDNKRIPLNKTQRDEKRGDETYPYFGANGEVDRIDDYIFDERIICVAEDGGSWGEGQKCAYIVDEKCWVNNHAHVLTAKNGLSLDYLRYYLNLTDLSKYITGTTRGKLTRGALERIKIPLPPLPEQKRIAEVLDKADALREKRRLALQKLDTLLQSVFLEMFGDPVKNPKGWKKGFLGDAIYSAKDGPHVSPSYVDEGIPFLSTRHIKPGKVVWEDLKHISPEDSQIHWRKCKPEKGDILYTKGGTTGIATMVDFDREVAVWVHVALLKTNHTIADALWLENMLNSSYCYVQSQRYTHGIANRDLGLKRMVNIEIYIPPLEEQKKFSNFAMKLKSLEKKNIKAFEDSENLFQSLQQRAFKGELFNDGFTSAQHQEENILRQGSLF